jgi:hypothetical protein
VVVYVDVGVDASECLCLVEGVVVKEKGEGRREKKEEGSWVAEGAVL